jgi:Nif-specific regulatory protein
MQHSSPNPLDPAARHDRELSALQAIAQVLSKYPGQRRMLTEVLDVLETKLEYTRGTIMLLSPDGTELLVEAMQGEEDAGRRSFAKYARGEGVTGRVLQRGEPAVIPRISEEPNFRGHVHGSRNGHSGEWSFLCVPITLGPDVVGTLSADIPYQTDILLDEGLRVLNIVSSMIANDVRARRLLKLERQRLEEENVRLRGELVGKHRPENIIGNSHAMRVVYERIRQVAPSETTVLIRGESGTGKELVASAVHYTSPRAQEPFVKVNCAALSENLLESELFGHEKGAFTGASQTRIGRIEQADGGTLFLDEIGDFSPAVQVKMLRVLQEKEFERVGSNTARRADVRILAATNRDLEADVESGRFRQDLYYRINVFPIHLPSLRDRKDDILPLANHFVEAFAAQMNKPVHRISTTAINMMLAYHWPGNVRELENCIEHAMLLSTDNVLHGYNLPASLQVPDDTEPKHTGSLKSRIALLEKDMIIDALKRTGGNVTAAARELGITPRMVRYKFKNLGIDYPKLFKKKSRTQDS